jgi:hypothetical protein
MLSATITVEGVPSLIAMNPSKIVLLAVLFSLTATGQTLLREQVELKIEKFKPTPAGFDVSVTIKNNGTRPVFIPRRPEKEVVLASLGIQQWDEQLGWQFVSPCSDVAPMSTVELRPSEELQSTISIRNMPHSERGLPVCNRKIERLGGQIRAVLSRAYENNEQFEALNPKNVEIVSRPVQLPATE